MPVSISALSKEERLQRDYEQVAPKRRKTDEETRDNKELGEALNEEGKYVYFYFFIKK